MSYEVRDNEGVIAVYESESIARTEAAILRGRLYPGDFYVTESE